jgi:deoxyinosine 3'endonuclease (endonuclease V)
MSTMSAESAVPVIGVAKKELALRVADALAENSELTETVEKLRSDLVALREETERQIEAAHSERDAAVAATNEYAAEAATLREKLDALRAALASDGKVLDIRCRTMSELYVRETIEQRLRGVIQRAGL